MAIKKKIQISANNCCFDDNSTSEAFNCGCLIANSNDPSSAEDTTQPNEKNCELCEFGQGVKLLKATDVVLILYTLFFVMGVIIVSVHVAVRFIREMRQSDTDILKRQDHPSLYYYICRKKKESCYYESI
ncbi:hypothetical protein QTN25_001655 [Entamoeba marina]